MKAIPIEEFVKMFRKRKDAAEYLGMEYYQLKRFEKRRGVVIGRSVYTMPRVDVRPVQLRTVHKPDFDEVNDDQTG